MIVMKFGGTSVENATAIARSAGIVRGRIPQKPVVVVSALARVTDQLIAMAHAAAGNEHLPWAGVTCAELRERHAAAARELLGGAEPATDLCAQLDDDFRELEAIIGGIAALKELTPRTLDNVAAFGERLSSRLVATAFIHLGIPSAHVDARDCIVTDGTHTRAVPAFDEIPERLRLYVQPLLDQDVVPVMAGFIGSTQGGITTTLGRGGSDFTAAIVGAGMLAEKIEIWTDVDGMMTTDPNLCADAHRIKSISFAEAAELAYFGAKVIHPATLLPAVQTNIPVFILNSRNPASEGTRISARGPACRNIFKAIAAKKRITIVDVVATRMLMAHGFLRSIFEVFDRHRCAVDMVSTSEVSVSLTVDSNEAIPAIASDLARLADVKYEGRKAIVCLVGDNIRNTPGIAAKVFSAIPEMKVRMISQGASEINISFVIDETDVPATVQLLHAAFFSDLDRSVFD